MLRNIKLTIIYDGTNFSGWELQPGKRSIRGEIEKTLLEVFKSHLKLISASRTDAGVHALGQVVNFKIKHSIPTSKIAEALNRILPKDVRVISAKEMTEGFNTRFDAKSKEYEYLIYNGEIMPPHLINLVWHIKSKLNLLAMKRAAKILVGKHDFSSFCASGGDDNNFIRNLYKVSIQKKTICIFGSRPPAGRAGKLSAVSCKFIGNGFLYKMVRNMVGTLVEAGLGKISLDGFRKILKARDRRAAGRTAPPQGLCLIGVSYRRD